MADCVFPQDIMLCILTRLPVKSLLRFKSVCKQWCELFATPKFIKMHHDQLSNDPKSQSFIIYSLSPYCDHTISIFKIDSNENKPTNLDHPYPGIFFRMDFVGCCNGLICLACPLIDQGILFLNPATKFSKFVPCSNVDFGVSQKLSIGFGYDNEGSDFKVVNIVCWEKKKKGKKMGIGVNIYSEMGIGAEIYSGNSDSWTRIEVGFKFSMLRTRNDVIVNGNPYWFAKIDENEVLLCFDSTKLVFKIVSLSTLNLDEVAETSLVDWKDSLAVVCTKNTLRVESLDVWVFNDGEKIWRKNYSFGPIFEVKVDRFLQCLRNGKILGKYLDGKLFMFDPEIGCVKEIAINEAQQHSFEIYGYTESLAYI